MRIPGLLGLLVGSVLLAGRVSDADGQSFSCPWADVSIGTVESEQLRRHGLSEATRLANKCNARMPADVRRRLCDALALPDCKPSGAQAVAEVMQAERKEPKKLKKADRPAPARGWLVFDDIDRRFRLADANGDSRVAPSEAAAHFALVCLGLFARFATSDRDRDGFLNSDEWPSLLISPSACSFRSPSVSGDSQVETFLSRMAAATESLQRELFAEADQDGNRCLTSLEVTHALRSATDLVNVMERFAMADGDASSCLTSDEWSWLLSTLVVAKGSN